jgi:hypothetical protein
MVGIVQPPASNASLVKIYALESQFQAAQNEYASIMNSNNCALEKSDLCLRATQLNGDMRSYLVQMSDLLKQYNPSLEGQPSVQSQQQKLFDLNASLEDEVGLFESAEQQLRNAEIEMEMRRVHWMAWTAVAGVLLAVALLKSTIK